MKQQLYAIPIRKLTYKNQIDLSIWRKRHIELADLMGRWNFKALDDDLPRSIYRVEGVRFMVTREINER